MRSFRTFLALSGAVTLAACGGDTGPQTVGGVAPPTGTPSASPTPTHSFVAPTDPKTYEGIGAVQHYDYYTESNATSQRGQLYAGDATTARDGGLSVTYNPRDAIFDITINRPKGGVTVANTRFQDPVHRTAFGGQAAPQAGVPNLEASRNIQYLQAGTSSGSTLQSTSPFYSGNTTPDGRVYSAAGSDYPVGGDQYSYSAQTLFYQKPGTTTKYVTYAGFVRNNVSGAIQQPDPSQPTHLRETYSFDRAAFVFGERTATSAVPKSGEGVFSGEMIASLVFNPMLDSDSAYPTYLQWMQGTQQTRVNFANMSLTTVMDGKLLAPSLDAYTSRQFQLAEGTAFHAEGSGIVDMVARGGFAGQFASACFASSCNAGNQLVIAGSSLDGTFFGPAAEEIGGSFRIVGGRPDERIDILGAFTGKK